MLIGITLYRLLTKIDKQAPKLKPKDKEKIGLQVIIVINAESTVSIRTSLQIKLYSIPQVFDGKLVGVSTFR